MGLLSRPFDRPLTAENVLASEYGEAFLKERVAASALVADTVYAAVRSEDGTEVHGLVVSVEFAGGKLTTNTFTENMGPERAECPAWILGALTAPPNDHARDWRERCLA